MSLPMESMYHSHGMPPPLSSIEALASYGDNAWLAAAVDKLARELARTKFHLQTINSTGEIEIVQKHQAQETLREPRESKYLITNESLNASSSCRRFVSTRV
jgi:hypothetical protein